MDLLTVISAPIANIGSFLVYQRDTHSRHLSRTLLALAECSVAAV